MNFNVHNNSTSNVSRGTNFYGNSNMGKKSKVSSSTLQPEKGKSVTISKYTEDESNSVKLELSDDGETIVTERQYNYKTGRETESIKVHSKRLNITIA